MAADKSSGSVILDISIFPSSTVPTRQSARDVLPGGSQTVRHGCTVTTAAQSGSSTLVWAKVT
jgi:hypothetical protein